jgi:hypothetical protein
VVDALVDRFGDGVSGTWRISGAMIMTTMI